MIVLFILLVILAVFLIAGLMISRHFEYIEQIEIAKNADTIFEYIRFLNNQDSFSKWATMDPNMKKTFTGTDGEVGAISSWDSDNKNVGKGAQEIIAIQKHKIDYEIRFEKPFKATNYAYMLVEAKSDNISIVKWGFKGSYPFPMHVFMKLMNLEKMLRNDLQIGLQNLKKQLN